MLRLIRVVGLLVVLVSILGCGSTPPPAKLTPVTGTVSLDGKPLPEGEISFILSGQAPTMLPVKAGTFSGMANAGSNVVEVRAYKVGPPLSTDPTKTPTKVNFIPDRFSSFSKLTADVAAGGGNDFKFDIASR